VRRKLVVTGLAVVLALAFAWPLAAIAIERAGSRAPPHRTWDAIVVLGCRVTPHGTASSALARRARRGAALLADGRASRLVLTGGVGDHAPSEARAALAIAREAGADADRIVLEERSTSTLENARFAREVLPDARSVLVVTDAYHALRAARFFRAHFEEVAVSAVTAGPRVRAWGALREVPLLVWALVRH
jgi:uncharacterized SAM-binding protein YcdF (DUF218 family)